MWITAVFQHALARSAARARRLSILDDDFVCDEMPSPVRPPGFEDSLQARRTDLDASLLHDLARQTGGHRVWTTTLVAKAC